MKRIAIAIVLLGAAAAAQDKMTDTLRKGVVEEESKKNTAAAIQNYQAVLTQYDEARQTAATALYRMAECYRKEGKNEQANAAFERLLRDFGDQQKLADQSRAALGPRANTSNQSKDAAQAFSDARARYRQSLEKGVDLAKQELAHAEQQYQLAAISSIDVIRAREKVVAAEQKLAAFDAGINR